MLVSDNLNTINRLNCKLINSEFVKFNILEMFGFCALFCHKMAIFSFFPEQDASGDTSSQKDKHVKFQQDLLGKDKGKKKKGIESP